MSAAAEDADIAGRVRSSSADYLQSLIEESVPDAVVIAVAPIGNAEAMIDSASDVARVDLGVAHNSSDASVGSWDSHIEMYRAEEAVVHTSAFQGRVTEVT